MIALKASDVYQRYLSGGTRPDNLPAYDTLNGEIIFYPSEVYCRFQERGIICPRARN